MILKIVPLDVFKQGKIEPFPGAGFTYVDDIWNLHNWNTVAATAGESLLNFESIVDWLKPIAKAYISYGWLAQDLSIGWMKGQLTSLRKLSEYFICNYPQLNQLINLDQRVAEGFADYLNERYPNQTAYLTARHIGNFGKWVRKQYKLPITFRPDHIVKLKREKDLIEDKTQVIPIDVIDQFFKVIGTYHQELWEKWKSTPPSKRTRITELLYLQALKILLCTPLRISQVLLLDRDPLRDSTNNEEPGVWIKYIESKSHQGEQEKYVPLEMADIVREAIEAAQTVTEEFYRRSGKNHLFLTDSKAAALEEGIRNISSKAFRSWLNGRENEEGEVVREGFIHRFNIKYDGEYYYLRPHQTRHTLASFVYRGGGGFGDVTNYLNHRNLKVLNKQTGVYVHGEERHLIELDNALAEGKLLGISKPLLENRSVFVGGMAEIDQAHIKSMGMYVQPTRYGFCTRPMHKGPCPNPRKCLHNREVTAPEPCMSALITPRAIEAINDDTKFLEEQTKLWKSEAPGSRGLKNVMLMKDYYDGIANVLIGKTTPEQEFGKDIYRTETEIEVGTKKRKNKSKDSKGIPPSAKGKQFKDKVTSKVYEIYNNMRANNDHINLDEFLDRAQISKRNLRILFPEIYKALALDKEKQVALEMKEKVNQAYQELTFAKEQHVELPITVLAQRLNVHRNDFYTIFPKDLVEELGTWNESVRNINKNNNQRILREQKERNSKERELAKQRRNQEILERIENELQNIENSGKFVAVEDFCKIINIGLLLFNTTFKDSKKRLDDLNRINSKRVERIKAMEEMLLTKWNEITSSNEPITVVEFANFCNVSRDIFYKDSSRAFFHWVEKIESYNIDIIESKKRAIIQEFNQMVKDGLPISVYQLSKRSAVTRHFINRHCTELLDEVIKISED